MTMSALHVQTDRRPSIASATPPLSPYILTPEPTGDDTHPSLIRGLSFAKHPIPSPALDMMSPHGHEATHDPATPAGSHKPVSLLSAMMSSPDAKRLAPRSRDGAGGLGLVSAQSSVPSTSISSPTSQPHGILQHAAPVPELPQPQQPTSILRRGSTSASSDAGDGPSGLGLMMNGLGMLGLDSVNKKLDKLDPQRLEKVEERRERIEWADELQKTVSDQPISRTPSQKLPGLKFAIAPMAPIAAPSASESQAASRRPSSPFARERAAQMNVDVDEEQDQDDEDEAEDDVEEDGMDEGMRNWRRTSAASAVRGEGDLDLDEDDDARSQASSVGGYDEDEEDGAFESDEDWPLGFEPRRRSITGESSKYPFARPTNYDRRNPDGLLSSPNGSPPAGPMLQLPPARRGRGHVKVDPAAASGTEGNRCSRHCSPPPQRSRSNSRTVDSAPAPSSSPSASRLKRTGSKQTGRRSVSPACTDDAGPRAGRAGSPMPERLAVSDEDEPESDADDAGGSPGSLNKLRGGWRSDDSVFYGPNAQRVNRTASDRVAGFSRNISAPPTRTVFDESDAEALSGAHTDGGPERSAIEGAGVREFFRRASEHLQGFARPIIGPPPQSQSVAMEPTAGSWHSHSTHVDAGLGPPQPTKPVLDETPALARSVSPRREGVDGGLARRLEKALAAPVPAPALAPEGRSVTGVGSDADADAASGQSVGLGRTKSLGSKVTFGPPPAKEALLHRSSTTALAPGTRKHSVGEGMLSQPIACQSGRKLEKIRARELS